MCFKRNFKIHVIILYHDSPFFGLPRNWCNNDSQSPRPDFGEGLSKQKILVGTNREVIPQSQTFSLVKKIRGVHALATAIQSHVSKIGHCVNCQEFS